MGTNIKNKAYAKTNPSGDRTDKEVKKVIKTLLRSHLLPLFSLMLPSLMMVMDEE
jgi:hypothetical protein